MPGHVPGISFVKARPCPVERDGRDEPGHDNAGAFPINDQTSEQIEIFALLPVGHF